MGPDLEGSKPISLEGGDGVLHQMRSIVPLREEGGEELGGTRAKMKRERPTDHQRKKALSLRLAAGKKT